jgi:hypothetical protein
MTPADLHRAEFNAWFDKYWEGDDPEDPNPVPFTGDWTMYQDYQRIRAAAWAGWLARNALQL